MPKKKLGSGDTVRIEFKAPVELKKQIDAAVERSPEPEDDLSKWMRRAARGEIERQAERLRKEGGRKT